MKKTVGKLRLHRETLHQLEARAVRGGAGTRFDLIGVTILTAFPETFTCEHCDSERRLCDSVASCTLLAEDCCVV